MHCAGLPLTEPELPHRQVLHERNHRMHRRYRTGKLHHFHHTGPNLWILANATGQGLAEIDSFHHSGQGSVSLDYFTHGTLGLPSEFPTVNGRSIEGHPQCTGLHRWPAGLPLTRTCAKLINYKNAAQLALLMLKEESGSSDFETIDSLCSEPCPSCDTENAYFKLNPPKRNFMQKCHSCEEFKNLSLN